MVVVFFAFEGMMGIIIVHWNTRQLEQLVSSSSPNINMVPFTPTMTYFTLYNNKSLVSPSPHHSFA
jgi:hypothetical protein